MGMSVAAYILLLTAVAVGRLAELGRSRRNQRRLAARGVAKVPEPYFHWMVVLHIGVLVAAGLEVVILRRPLLPALALAMGLLFIFANVLRWWVIATLAEHWNVQVMDSAALGIVTSGPYRWIRHPNYVAVGVELLALPLIHTAWLTAIVAGLANAWVIRRRLAVEEQILLADPTYRAMMGPKPRFLPRFFARSQTAGASELPLAESKRTRML